MDNKELKDRVAFSSVNSPNEVNNNVDPTKAIDRAFRYQEEMIQRQEIETVPIKQVVNTKTQIEPRVERKVEEQPVDEPQQEVVVESEKKVIKVKKKMKKKVKITLIFIIILTLSIIGLYKFNNEYLNNPKVVTKKGLTSLANEIDNILNINDEATLIGDNFSLDSTIKLQITSSELEDKELLKKINNINNGYTSLSIKQDIKNKQFMCNRKTYVNDKEIINDKYLIQNSTEYYFVQGFFDKYINNGNNNYFETISKDKNAIYNIKYLYRVITSSIADSIDNDYYEVTNTKTYLYEKNENVKKFSIKLDNKKLNKVLNNIIKDLKEDKEANDILTGVFDDFSDYKVDSKILNKDDYIVINLYTQGILNDTEKYEFIIKKDNKDYNVTYEKNKKEITIMEDNKLKNYIVYSNRSDNIRMTIKDKNKKEIGTLSYEYTDLRKQFRLVYDDGSKKADIELNYKASNKNKDSYDSTITGNFNIREDEKNNISGTVDIKSKIVNKVKINEDVDDVIFKSEISEENYKKLDELLETRMSK